MSKPRHSKAEVEQQVRSCGVDVVYTKGLPAEPLPKARCQRSKIIFPLAKVVQNPVLKEHPVLLVECMIDSEKGLIPVRRNCQTRLVVGGTVSATGQIRLRPILRKLLRNRVEAARRYDVAGEWSSPDKSIVGRRSTQGIVNLISGAECKQARKVASQLLGRRNGLRAGQFYRSLVGVLVGISKECLVSLRIELRDIYWAVNTEPDAAIVGLWFRVACTIIEKTHG